MHNVQSKTTNFQSKSQKNSHSGEYYAKNIRDRFSNQAEDLPRETKKGEACVASPLAISISTCLSSQIVVPIRITHIGALGELQVHSECTLQAMRSVEIFAQLQVVPKQLLIVWMNTILDDGLRSFDW